MLKATSLAAVILVTYPSASAQMFGGSKTPSISKTSTCVQNVIDFGSLRKEYDCIVNSGGKFSSKATNKTQVIIYKVLNVRHANACMVKIDPDRSTLSEHIPVKFSMTVRDGKSKIGTYSITPLYSQVQFFIDTITSFREGYGHASAIYKISYHPPIEFCNAYYNAQSPKLSATVYGYTN